ncbi:hypothetical protein CEXT_180921 [Caerostris extrusa]|uniref:Uncharacterized protein n=1 Tax=Caerostris extrusa TaxID=172846 RepID=A0AAV4XBQ7_CAEEX|nr:hypothetical protein CEXT_180921 [Caerostris extrusa]
MTRRAENTLGGRASQGIFILYDVIFGCPLLALRHLSVRLVPGICGAEVWDGPDKVNMTEIGKFQKQSDLSAMFKSRALKQLHADHTKKIKTDDPLLPVYAKTSGENPKLSERAETDREKENSLETSAP